MINFFDNLDNVILTTKNGYEVVVYSYADLYNSVMAICGIFKSGSIIHIGFFNKETGQAICIHEMGKGVGDVAEYDLIKKIKPMEGWFVLFKKVFSSLPEMYGLYYTKSAADVKLDMLIAQGGTGYVAQMKGDHFE